MNIPLQQTKKWQKLQEDLGEATIFQETVDYTILAIKKHTRFGTYLYLPYGPYIRTPEAAENAYKAIQSLARSENAVFVRIEPQDAKTAEFWASLPCAHKSTDLSPRETWVLDLAPTREEIISGFSQGTRTRFNQFAKKGLSVTVSDSPADIKHLVALQHKLAHQKNFGVFSEHYLKTELQQDFASLYLVHYEDKVIAASLFFDDDETRYYMQSAADLEYKKLPGTVALLTTALFDAKDKGLKHFDFWGIAPVDESGNVPKNHPWAGFTAFKKSFGGREVSYCGTYDLVFQPVKYKFYQLARRGNRFLRKLR